MFLQSLRCSVSAVDEPPLAVLGNEVQQLPVALFDCSYVCLSLFGDMTDTVSVIQPAMCKQCA